MVRGISGRNGIFSYIFRIPVSFVSCSFAGYIFLCIFLLSEGHVVVRLTFVCIDIYVGIQYRIGINIRIDFILLSEYNAYRNRFHIQIEYRNHKISASIVIEFRIEFISE